MTGQDERVLESPRLRQLEARLSARPDDGSELVDAFWAEVVESGTPLIDLDDTRPEHGLVTWLFRETAPVHKVLVREVCSWKSDHERQLARLGETDIWFLSWWVRRDLRCTYAFEVTDAHGQHSRLADPLSQHREANDKAPVPDPLNRHQQRGDWFDDVVEDSVLVMPDARELPWWAERPDVPRGNLHAHTFRSEILGNERPIWVHTPAGFDSQRAEAYPFMVIFDGEAHHSAPRVLDNLVAAGEVPPMVLILVNQIGIRDRELTCNPDFSRMLATELVPWARNEYHLTEDPALAGLNGRSFGGLCSAWTALQHPEVFGNAFMQSGSCWMHPSVIGGYTNPDGNPEPLPVGEGAQVPSIIAAYQTTERVPVRIYQECGTVENGPPPAWIWQTFGNRWFHDLLELKGYDTVYREFVGGHDDAWWRGTFADGLIWLFGKRKSASRDVIG